MIGQMNLPMPSDIKKNFILLFDVAKLKPDSTSLFGTEDRSLSKSFSLAPFLFPIFYISIMNYTLSFDDSVSITAIAYKSLLLYSTFWTLFPVVIYAMGYRENIWQFVIVRNWLLVANYLILMFASLGSPFAFIGLVVGLYINVMEWFILKDVFKLSNGRAVVLFLVQLVLTSSVMVYYFFSLGIDFEKYLEASRAAAAAAGG